MSTRRRLLGNRPSSAYASPKRSGARWTPDFSAGAAGLELEAIVNRFHLAFRSTAIMSSGLKLLARPEDVRDPIGAWSALALEAASSAYMWRRTRVWQSMLDPWVSSVDALVGIAAVALGSRSMHVQSQIDGTAWTNRVLTVRLTSVPLSERRGRDLVVGVGMQLVSHIVRPPAGSRWAIARVLALPVVYAMGQTVFLGRATREQARTIDARALRWAAEELDLALDAEESAFRNDLLRPTSAALAEIADLLARADERADERAEAIRRAREEERRVRAWLSSTARAWSPPADRSDQLAIVDASLRRFSRRVQGGMRFVAAAADALHVVHRRDEVRHRRLALGTGALLAARGVLAAAVTSERGAHRIDDVTVTRLLAVADVVATAATGVHQLAERHDPAVVGWIERFVLEVATSSAIARCERPPAIPDLAIITAVRALVTATEPRSRPRRVAAVVNELLIVATSHRQAGQAYESSLEMARNLTVATLDLDDHWTAVDDVRVGHRAFVHDGAAQVLAAIATLSPDEPCDPAVRTWLDRERVRLDARAGCATAAPETDVPTVLASLAHEFAARRLEVVWESSSLPAWTGPIASTVGSIVREALNNVVKHTTCRYVWCGVLELDDGSVQIRICDYAEDFPVFRPGDGTGTTTMRSLAAIIGADIDWFQTPTGGTEVRVLLHPTPAAQASDVTPVSGNADVSERSLR